VHVSSPVVVQLRHPRRSEEFEACRTERPGKEAPPEGPRGDGWMPCRAALPAYSPEPAGRVVRASGGESDGIPRAKKRPTTVSCAAVVALALQNGGED
jgi:hypothetical protein